MARLIKICTLVTMLVFAMIGVAHATPITLKRGLNLDIWDTWPGEERWGERDVLLYFPEWQNKITFNDLLELKANGFDFVRMPVDPAPLLSSKTVAFRGELYASIAQAVDAIVDSGLKVVVDLHAIPAGNRSSGSDSLASDAALFDRYVEVVGRLAGTLRSKNSDMVAIELMNEPIAGCDDNAAKWEQMQKRLFDAARSAAPRLTIILSGGCWGGAESLAEIDPNSFQDDNIIWTFHSYAPFVLTHQGATWAGDFIRYVNGIPYPPHGANAAQREAALKTSRERIRMEAPSNRRSGMLSYLDELMAEIDTPEKLQSVMSKPFDIAAKWADQHGVDRGNMLLGEFGMIRQEFGNADVMAPEWRAAYVADMIELAENSGFSWSIWGYGGAFGIIEAFEGRDAEPAVLDVVKTLKTSPEDH